MIKIKVLWNTVKSNEWLLFTTAKTCLKFCAWHAFKTWAVKTIALLLFLQPVSFQPETESNQIKRMHLYRQITQLPAHCLVLNYISHIFELHYVLLGLVKQKWKKYLSVSFIWWSTPFWQNGWKCSMFESFHLAVTYKRILIGFPISRS